MVLATDCQTKEGMVGGGKQAYPGQSCDDALLAHKEGANNDEKIGTESNENDGNDDNKGAEDAEENSPSGIPANCKVWFNGCNECTRTTAGSVACTEMTCVRQNEPRCKEKFGEELSRTIACVSFGLGSGEMSVGETCTMVLATDCQTKEGMVGGGKQAYPGQSCDDALLAHKEAGKGTVDGASSGDSTPAPAPINAPTAGSCTCFDRNPNSGEASIPNTANGCGFDDEPDASGCVMVSSEDECRIADWIEGAQIQGGLLSVAKFTAGGQCTVAETGSIASAGATTAHGARRLRGSQ